MRGQTQVLAGALIGLATGIVLGGMGGILLERMGPDSSGGEKTVQPVAASKEPSVSAGASDLTVRGEEAAESPEGGESESVQVSIFGVFPTGGASAVVLLLPRAESAGEEQAAEEGEGREVVPIHIGIFEAMAIQRELDGDEPPRPMTHDLMENVIRDLGGTVENVTVTELKGGVYYAIIRVRAADGSRKEIDARPSDSMALAVRLGVPLCVSKSVWAQMKEGAEEMPAEAPEEVTPTPGVFF